VNLLVAGVSYRTAPVALLERMAVPSAEMPDVLQLLLGRSYVGEAVMLSTCNRTEVYAAVSAFHGGLTDIAAVLAAHAGYAPADLAPHLYVHYEADAVRHAYRIAAGLDSMVVGEAQILGQLRDAYAVAVEHDAVGRLLHELMQQALRVGKRAHAETGIDRVGASVVGAALEVAGTYHRLAGVPALVIGAGAMGSLALATLRRAAAGALTVGNRSAERAAHLAEAYGASVTPLDDVAGIMSTVDIVVCATAATEPVLTLPAVRAALARRDPDRPLVVLDLAVPRDVDPAVADLPGVVLVDIGRLGTEHRDRIAPADVAAAEQIVADEVEAFLVWLRSSDVAPTVAALRARAEEVVTVELGRLAQRRPELTEEQHAEIARMVHRVVQRLLHSPTVRVRELAGRPDGIAAAALLRELFDLDVLRPSRADKIPTPTGGEFRVASGRSVAAPNAHSGSAASHPSRPGTGAVTRHESAGGLL
jgi:glutamyl-tRNA reductase